MRIMGVDPGTLKMGVGIIEKTDRGERPIMYTTLKASSKKHVHSRLRFLFDSVRDIIEEFKPDVVALEDVFFGVNVKSAIRIGEARSVVILAANLAGLDVKEYLPTKVKSAVCGNGRAAKVQVQQMVRVILSLRQTPESDAADALAIALCHLNSVRFEVKGKR